MVPRSANDKEYFPQDWFAERAAALGLTVRPQGRNSYPNFWVGNEARPPCEGYEIKSLAFTNGLPARRDYDSNSTIPSGRKDGRDVFLVFFLYTCGCESAAGALGLYRPRRPDQRGLRGRRGARQ